MITDQTTIHNAIIRILADPKAVITPKDYRAMMDFRHIILAGGNLTPDQIKYASGMIGRYALGKRR